VPFGSGLLFMLSGLSPTARGKVEVDKEEQRVFRSSLFVNVFAAVRSAFVSIRAFCSLAFAALFPMPVPRTSELSSFEGLRLLESSLKWYSTDAVAPRNHTSRKSRETVSEPAQQGAATDPRPTSVVGHSSTQNVYAQRGIFPRNRINELSQKSNPRS